MSPPEHFDVLVVGAGLSGVGAGYHLKRRSPRLSFAILEARAAIGGTWDLFRYPGVRSDSDMYTLGYAFAPWREAKAIADGPSILNYVRETAAHYGIDRHIRFHHRVVRAEWSSEAAAWTVEVARDDTAETVRFTCGFLFMCSGYYNYAQGYTPDFPGIEDFGGRIVHPQQWPADLAYEGKRVVVIGSGATAVTLVPAMAEKAAHVVMLQRSPTYVVSRPAEDAFANRLRRRLPAKLAYDIVRWRNVLFGMYFFNLARKKPDETKRAIIDMVKGHLGPDYDVATHFTPRYNPWDQRLCLVPDADLFAAINAGKVSIVTDKIETIDRAGVRLASGRRLDADIIVTATGLQMQLMSGIDFIVDGAAVDLSKTLTYKGMMYSDVPNLAQAFGYTNASWTLKCDLTCEYVCRLINHMRRRRYVAATPRRNDPTVVEAPWLEFTSGYVQRALSLLPRQGSKRPWKLYQNYALDLVTLRFGAVNDEAMEFTRAAATRKAA